ncbi:MAG: sugar transferase [Actinomycetales bacterium]|nr:sugar transferase [Actinomycetales bacterium]
MPARATPGQRSSGVHDPASSAATPRTPLRRRPVARAMDLVLTVLLLIVASPLIVALAAAVAMSSRGPVIYRQTRVGLGGVTFAMPKYRTMRHETDESMPDLEALRDPSSAGPDGRVTGVGRFLRRWSLDELPQLWTVLKGDMALVGPRPMLVDELPLLAPQHAERHAVKPGLTGLWQVSGRKDVPWDDRMQLDLAYLGQASLGTDLSIIVRTVPAIVRGKGAY